MSNQHVTIKINQEVLENKKLRAKFDYSKSRAWIVLTEVFHPKLRLAELVQIVKQVEIILKISAPRIAKRYKAPSIKFLDENWDQVEPILNQITLIPRGDEDDGENENSTNYNFPNQTQIFNVNIQNYHQQIQKQTEQLQQPIVQPQQNIEEYQHEMERLQEQQQEQSLQNEFSGQNTVRFTNYNVFDPNSEIALNSRYVENQDQQSNDQITGDFWSDDNDTTQITYNETTNEFTYFGDY